MPIVLETRSWWAFVLRGVVTFLFGMLALLLPEMAVFTLVLTFGAYAVVAGVFDVLAAVRTRAPGATPSWALFASGVVSVLLGLVALFSPGLTATPLLYLIATWALATGILEIAAAAHLRKEIRGEWLLVASGIASVAFGAFLVAFPRAGALALLFWIGAYALLLGVLLVLLGAELRRIGRMTPPEREALAGSR
jgi:uncharacterized membrane protein HdeD (DUF308 family)